jgi:hypothetical protein
MPGRMPRPGSKRRRAPAATGKPSGGGKPSAWGTSAACEDIDCEAGGFDRLTPVLPIPIEAVRIL